MNCSIRPWLHLLMYYLPASRIRGLVASIPFEQFHKHSTEIIQAAAFGKDADGVVRQELVFTANNLVSVHRNIHFLFLFVHLLPPVM